MILNFYPTEPRAQTAFQFDHAQAHISLAWNLNNPVRAGNIANYLLDPAIDPIGPMPWGQRHQSAHDKAADFYDVQPSLDMADEVTGSPIWTWFNYTEHDLLSGAALAAGFGS